MGFDFDSKSTKWPNSMAANLILLTASFRKGYLCEDVMVFQQNICEKD